MCEIKGGWLVRAHEDATTVGGGLQARGLTVRILWSSNLSAARPHLAAAINTYVCVCVRGCTAGGWLGSQWELCGQGARGNAGGQLTGTSGCLCGWISGDVVCTVSSQAGWAPQQGMRSNAFSPWESPWKNRACVCSAGGSGYVIHYVRIV